MGLDCTPSGLAAFAGAVFMALVEAEPVVFASVVVESSATGAETLAIESSFEALGLVLIAFLATVMA